jgi:hypothetical protein
VLEAVEGGQDHSVDAEPEALLDGRLHQLGAGFELAVL